MDELGYLLLLNINRKPYMGTPMVLSHLTLKGQSHSDFGVLYLVEALRKPISYY